MRMTEGRDQTGFTISRPRFSLVLAYFVAASAALMYLHVGLVPDVLVPVMIGAAFIVGRPWLFLRDWGVFLLVVVLWQQTGPVAQWAGFPLHMADLINADRWLASPFLHGQLPQVWLQQRLYHQGSFHPASVPGTFYRIPQWRWYDIVSAVLYGLHFPEPLVVGFVVWLRDRALFRRFAAAFLLLAAMSFVIYIIYPAVPPWMAAKTYRATPYVYKIFDDFNYAVQQKLFGHQYFTLLNVSYNRVAAMPSLHAAFPVLSALYLYKACGRWGLLMLAYAAFMWFAVVYMGEHWVVDVLVGLVCAVVAYADVESVARWWSERPMETHWRPRIPAFAVPPLVPAGIGGSVRLRRALVAIASVSRRLAPEAAVASVAYDQDTNPVQRGAYSYRSGATPEPLGYMQVTRSAPHVAPRAVGVPTELSIDMAADDQRIRINVHAHRPLDDDVPFELDVVTATVDIASGQFYGQLATTIWWAELAALHQILSDLDSRVGRTARVRWQLLEAALSLTFTLDRPDHLRVEVGVRDADAGTRMEFSIDTNRTSLSTWAGEVGAALAHSPLPIPC